MGYATQIISVQKDKYQYTVQLEKKPYELDEVVVKEAPITRKKDTLNYYVESFRQKEDYSIEDVLKRMPGIEVTTSGQILYQGSSINKLNIEGLDLMGDQYNQATQNMPAEAVSTIQVMENNQPIRALEGKIHSKPLRICQLRPYLRFRLWKIISPSVPWKEKFIVIMRHSI